MLCALATASLQAIDMRRNIINLTFKGQVMTSGHNIIVIGRIIHASQPSYAPTYLWLVA